MKKLVMIIFTLVACTGQVNKDSHDENRGEKENKATGVRLNDSKKWKADDATKDNVGLMIRIVSDSSYAKAEKRKEFHSKLQEAIDSLISQCRMKGADHDALHLWLEKVLEDMKELKEGDRDHSLVYRDLKKNILSFNDLFE